MKKILVTTDLSEGAEGAFDVSRTLSDALGAELSILTVVEDPQQAAMVYAMEFPVYPDADIRKQLVDRVKNELLKVAGKHFSGMEVSTHVVEASGPVHREIIEFATQMEIDLIVIASHGRTGIKHLLIGSVAERLAREAQIAVLIVPTKKGS